MKIIATKASSTINFDFPGLDETESIKLAKEKIEYVHGFKPKNWMFKVK